MSGTKTDREHTEEMKKVQAAQNAKLAAMKEADTGFLMVNTGNGKGKSTSALGTILRALGWGHAVGVVQYVKGNWKTGERLFFEQHPELVTWHTMGKGFTWDTQDKNQDREAAEAAWEVSKELLSSGDYDLVVLDELNIVLRTDTLPIAEVMAGLQARHNRTSVLVTGRDAKPEMIAAADLVTSMEMVKHPFDAGIKAKRGIDF